MKTSKIQEIVQRYEERTWVMRRVYNWAPCGCIHLRPYPSECPRLQGGPCIQNQEEID